SVAECGCRFDRLLLALRHHTEKTAVTHHCGDARQAAGARFIERLESSPRARWPDDAAVEHSWVGQGLHEAPAARHPRGEVDALTGLPNDPVVVRSLRLHVAGDGTAEALSAEHLPVGRTQVTPGGRYRAVLDHERIDGHPEMLRRDVQHVVSGFGGRL